MGEIEHEDSPSCWCIPYIEKVCPYCGNDEMTKQFCTYCGGHGWVQATIEDYYDEDTPTITIHHSFQ